MKTKSNYASEKLTVGCHIDESAGSADDCNRRTIEFAQQYGFNPEPEWESEDYEYLSEVGDDAVAFLNDLETRPYMYWTFEDNSLYLAANVEEATEDCEFVSSKDQDYPADDYRGEWLHVSDHGNATLYCRGEDGKDIEVWATV